MKKRKIIIEDDIYISKTDTIDLDRLTLLDFKTFVINELSKPCVQRQAYLTEDSGCEGKYLFWWNGQVRFLSEQVVKNMLRKEKLFYYSDKAFDIKNMIVGKNFKWLLIDKERVKKAKVKIKKRRWIR